MLNIDDFIRRQFEAWPEVAERFEALKHVQTKEVAGYRVQFNPARAISTNAKVDAASIASRPCFLCAGNRPKQQLKIDWEDLEILINPYPIFPGHLTIAAKEHIPQSMRGRVEQMRRLSRELPGYTIFFNGAKCGASAPDHMHFQAVPSRFMRIPKRFYTYTLPRADFWIEEIDPMVNLVCTDEVVTVIPRRKHRPDCYPDIHISPAAIDLCGTLISVNEREFNEYIDESLIDTILKEVTFRDPPIYVGLHTVTPEITPMPDGSSIVAGIVIGKDFHWQRVQRQRFDGELFFFDKQLVNRLSLEEYLKSVISSEMSAMSSPELLKAHAIISRSWVLAQMRLTRKLADTCSNISEHREGEICTWFDHSDHLGFDVCSDDHCQRYQGTDHINECVAEAVEATSGVVLISNGKICDARFSKCCGGAFERFENCWQPVPHSYLRDGCDIIPSAPLPDLSVEENARKWILSRPEAFCGNASDIVLAQVLNNFDRETTPDFFRWTVRYTQIELSELIHRRSGIDFGTILDIRPLNRGASGRITRLKIVGQKQSKIIGKELIIRRWLSESHLYSSAFIVEREGSDFIIRGAGWGHGVGLCQIGAAVMASLGYSYTQILEHYFPGTTLGKLLQ